MEVSQGANIVGMLMLSLNVCPLSLLIKKNKNKALQLKETRS